MNLLVLSTTLEVVLPLGAVRMAIKAWPHPDKRGQAGCQVSCRRASAGSAGSAAISLSIARL